MKTISVILPGDGAEDRLQARLAQVRRQAALLPLRAEVLVVGLPGQRGPRDAEDAGPYVRVRWIPGPDAAEGGLRGAVLQSAGDYVLILGDGASVPLAEVLHFLPHFDRGADVVIGSRYMGFSRGRRKPRLAQRFGHLVVSCLRRWLLIREIGDARCGFTCYRGPVARQLFLHGRVGAPAADLEALARAQRLAYTLVELPVAWRPLERSVAARGTAACVFLADLLRVRWRLRGRRLRHPAGQAT